MYHVLDAFITGSHIKANTLVYAQNFYIEVLIFYILYFAVLTEITQADQRYLLQDVLENIDVPILTLWGDNDQVSYKSMQLTKSLQDHCGLTVIKRLMVHFRFAF